MTALVLMVLFILGMVGIGLWGMRRTATLGDFFLGGRTIGPWISAFAYGTTYFSAALGAGNAPIAASLAILAPFLVVPAVSLFTRPPPAGTIERAFRGSP
jgi:Na+/proline symporter